MKFFRTVYFLPFFFFASQSLSFADDGNFLKRWRTVQDATQGGRLDDLFGGTSIVFKDEKKHFDRHIVRFGVQYDGRPVFFQNGAALLDERGAVRRISNPSETLTPPLDEGMYLGDAEISALLADYGIETDRPFERGYMARGPDRRLVPVVRVEESHDTVNAQTWYLSAETGGIVFSEPLLQTHTDLLDAGLGDDDATDAGDEAVFGAIYRENPRITPDVEIVPVDFLDEDALHLYGKYARVESCVNADTCKETAPVASRSDTVGEEFVFSPEEDVDAADPFAEVNAYYNITSASDWIRDNFGWYGLFNGETWIQVKVGRYWENAGYYSGSETRAPYIVFGRTENINFAYDADTARHEFGHAINDLFWDHPWASVDSLGLDTSMFAVEEALADIWALTYTGDPMLNGMPGYTRNADNDYTCPHNLIGEGHLDGRIVDGFAWDLREAVGKTAFEHILYRSLSFLGDNAGYDDFVSALEASAESLLDEGEAGVESRHIEAIRETARARGLLDEDCRNRIVPLADKQTLSAVGYGRLKTAKKDYPFGLQWKIQFPAGAKSAVLYLTWTYPTVDGEGNAVEPGYRVHVRRGAPVEVLWLDDEEQTEGEPVFTVVADETFDDSPTMVAYPFTDLSPPEEGEELFVLLSAASETSVIAIRGTLRFKDETAFPASETPTDASLSPKETGAVTGAASCSAGGHFGSSNRLFWPAVLF